MPGMTDKAKDIARSALSAKAGARQRIRTAKRARNRHLRRTEQQALHQIGPEEWDDGFAADTFHYRTIRAYPQWDYNMTVIVRDRRDHDNLSSLRRWAQAHIQPGSTAEKARQLEGLLGRDIAGWHAVQHARWTKETQ